MPAVLYYSFPPAKPLTGNEIIGPVLQNGSNVTVTIEDIASLAAADFAGNLTVGGALSAASADLSGNVTVGGVLSAGSVEISNAISAANAFVTGYDAPPSVQGAMFTWNLVPPTVSGGAEEVGSGGGDAVILNQYGGGNGGFAFYDGPNGGPWTKTFGVDGSGTATSGTGRFSGGLYTKNNVLDDNSGNATISGALAANVQAINGLTVTSLAERFGNRLDLVADFGADPTGATDISGPLNNAIATGKPIFIPPGIFLLSGSVTDPGLQNVDICGAGPLATTINLSGSIAISQTGSFTIYFSLQNCGVTFLGTGAITLAGATYNNSQPDQGPLFQNNYFYVPSTYTGAGPVLNFTTVSSGRMMNNMGVVDADGAFANFIEVSGQSMNWEFGDNQFWDNLNGSNTANITNGIFLNGSSTDGIQGTRISNTEIVGFHKNVNIGPYNGTTQITNCMLDQGYYSLYIEGAGINDIRVSGTYLASSAAANSGSSAVYIGASTAVKLHDNVIAAYNSGNYSIDMSAAAPNSVVEYGNTMDGEAIYNPNNVPLEQFKSASPITAPNVLSNQIVLSANTVLTAEQAGSYVFWTGADGTITLPLSTSWNQVGGGKFLIQNQGSGDLTLAVQSPDTNHLLNGGVLPPGNALMAISNYGYPGWITAVQSVLDNALLLGTLSGTSADLTGNVTVGGSLNGTTANLSQSLTIANSPVSAANTPGAALVALTPAASPWTYTVPERGQLVLSGGTVTEVSLTRSGVTVPYDTSSTTFSAMAGDSLTVTYTAAPTATFVPL